MKKDKKPSVIKILNNLDLVSKVILLLMITISVYSIYSFISKKRIPITDQNNNSYMEVSQDYSLDIRDHVFEHYSQDRYDNDLILNVFLNKPISAEDFKKLEIKIMPEQTIKAELSAENLIQIFYDQEAPKDGKENIILFLLNGKQVGRISYINLTTYNTEGENLQPVKKYLNE